MLQMIKGKYRLSWDKCNAFDVCKSNHIKQNDIIKITKQIFKIDKFTVIIIYNL